MTTPRRARVLGWVVIAIVPLVTLAALEGAARLIGAGPSGRPEVPAWLHPGILVKEKDWIDLLSSRPGDLASYYKTYRWDKDLFYRLQPGLSLTLTDVAAPDPVRSRTQWTLRTGRLGYNTPDVDRRKAPGTFRVVALGESSTFGWGVDPDESYPRRLEALLRARHPGMRIEVINLGVCGYSSFQGRILLDRDALAFEPDVVTLSYGSNDYSEVPEPFDVARERNQGWTGSLRGALYRSHAYRAAAAWWGRRRQGATSAPMVLNVGPDKSRGNLAAMARRVRESGADPLFVENCTPGDMAVPMQSAASEEHVPLLKTSLLLADAAGAVQSGALHPPEMAQVRARYGDALLREFPWLAMYLADHCHPNAAGQRLLAEALVPLVESAPSFRRAAPPGAAGAR